MRTDECDRLIRLEGCTLVILLYDTLPFKRMRLRVVRCSCHFTDVMLRCHLHKYYTLNSVVHGHCRLMFTFLFVWKDGLSLLLVIKQNIHLSLTIILYITWYTKVSASCKLIKLKYYTGLCREETKRSPTYTESVFLQAREVFQTHVCLYQQDHRK